MLFRSYARGCRNSFSPGSGLGSGLRTILAIRYQEALILCHRNYGHVHFRTSLRVKLEPIVPAQEKIVLSFQPWESENLSGDTMQVVVHIDLGY